MGLFTRNCLDAFEWGDSNQKGHWFGAIDDLARGKFYDDYTFKYLF